MESSEMDVNCCNCDLLAIDAVDSVSQCLSMRPLHVERDKKVGLNETVKMF